MPIVRATVMNGVVAVVPALMPTKSVAMMVPGVVPVKAVPCPGGYSPVMAAHPMAPVGRMPMPLPVTVGMMAMRSPMATMARQMAMPMMMVAPRLG